MKRFFKFLMFEEKSAEDIQLDPTHERHTERWNERYWHGYAAAMRHVQQRLMDEFPSGFRVVTRQRGEPE